MTIDPDTLRSQLGAVVAHPADGLAPVLIDNDNTRVALRRLQHQVVVLTDAVCELLDEVARLRR